MQQSESKRKQDMSIEEILNSIRGVIDGNVNVATEPSFSQPQEHNLKDKHKDQNASQEILELTNIVHSKDVPIMHQQSVMTNADNDTKYANTEIDKTQLQDTSAQNLRSKNLGLQNTASHIKDYDPEMEFDHLISKEVANQTSRSIQDFASSAKSAIEESNKLKCITVEELVTQALKPMLQEWLNKNLPLIVRDVVTLELKKLIPNNREEKDKKS